MPKSSYDLAASAATLISGAGMGFLSPALTVVVQNRVPVGADHADGFRLSHFAA
jgi:hypothetical protein